MRMKSAGPGMSSEAHKILANVADNAAAKSGYNRQKQHAENIRFLVHSSHCAGSCKSRYTNKLQCFHITR